MKVDSQKIKEVREFLGLTTSDLASKFDPPVTRQMVEHWERNGVTTFNALNRIAQALGVNPERLLE